MNANELERSLSSLFGELVHGAAADGAVVLNPGDVGLLAALEALSAADASRSRNGGGTVAAHVDHLCFGVSLLNRWSAGERDPFAGADWTASWKRTTVSEAEWAELRRRLRVEVERWHAALQTPRDASGIELDGVIGSVVHLAYHLGAIRQIATGARGPRASDFA